MKKNVKLVEAFDKLQAFKNPSTLTPFSIKSFVMFKDPISN